jgi:hypothetical protein
MENEGFFLTFESIDGLGKTTQLLLLDKALRDAGHATYITKEPGDDNFGSNIGAGVRKLLFKNPTTLNMSPGVADMLLLADHIQTSWDCEREKAEGKVVISDRYADSQFAYASAPGKKCPQWALDVYALNYGAVPDLTILLVARGEKVPVPFPPPTRGSKLVEDISFALNRAKSRKGAESGKQEGKAWNDLEAQRTIQNAYLHYLAGLDRTFVVDVWDSSDVGSIHETILVEVLRRMERKQTVSYDQTYKPGSRFTGVQ